MNLGKNIRQDFPMYNENGKYKNVPLHYLDNSATTFKPYPVIKAINNYNYHMTCNAHRGDYTLAYDVSSAFEKARSEIASFINAKNEEIIFTSSTTMSLNELAYMLEDTLLEGDEVVISKQEHASNVLPWFNLKKRKGIEIKYVDIESDGNILPSKLEKVMSSKTKIVSLASVSNVLGYPLDVKALAKVAHDNNAIYIADAAQSIAHNKTDVKDLDVDFLCFSGHKMLGPTGIGVLYGKIDSLKRLDPVFLGGEMNARFYSDSTYTLADIPLRFEAGTQNIAGVLGLAAACSYLNRIGFENISYHELKLKKHLIELLRQNNDVVIYNELSPSGIITFNVKDVFSQDVASYLSTYGIYVRTGTHCAKLLPEVIEADTTIRASLYIYNNIDDVDELATRLKSAKEDYLNAFFSK